MKGSINRWIRSGPVSFGGVTGAASYHMVRWEHVYLQKDFFGVGGGGVINTRTSNEELLPKWVGRIYNKSKTSFASHLGKEIPEQPSIRPV
jgi:hypothetical protein